MEEENKQEQTEQPEQKPSMVASAHEAAEKLRAENERMEANIKRLEELKAFEQLGGKTDAGEQNPHLTQDQQFQQQAQKEADEIAGAFK